VDCQFAVMEEIRKVYEPVFVKFFEDSLPHDFDYEDSNAVREAWEHWYATDGHLKAESQTYVLKPVELSIVHDNKTLVATVDPHLRGAVAKLEANIASQIGVPVTLVHDKDGDHEVALADLHPATLGEIALKGEPVHFSAPTDVDISAIALDSLHRSSSERKAALAKYYHEVIVPRAIAGKPIDAPVSVLRPFSASKRASATYVEPSDLEYFVYKQRKDGVDFATDEGAKERIMAAIEHGESLGVSTKVPEDVMLAMKSGSPVPSTGIGKKAAAAPIEANIAAKKCQGIFLPMKSDSPVSSTGIGERAVAPSKRCPGVLLPISSNIAAQGRACDDCECGGKYVPIASSISNMPAGNFTFIGDEESTGTEPINGILSKLAKTVKGRFSRVANKKGKKSKKGKKAKKEWKPEPREPGESQASAGGARASVSINAPIAGPPASKTAEPKLPFHYLLLEDRFPQAIASAKGRQVWAVPLPNNRDSLLADPADFIGWRCNPEHERHVVINTMSGIRISLNKEDPSALMNMTSTGVHKKDGVHIALT